MSKLIMTVLLLAQGFLGLMPVAGFCERRGTIFNDKTPFDEDKIRNLFLDYSANRLRYDLETKKIYGISCFSRSNHFISIPIETGKVEILNKFVEITGLPFGLSAIDTKNKRYIFVGSVNKNYFLYVLDINTGDIILKNKLENRFQLFEYNYETDELYGLSKIDGKTYLVRYDIYKNKITIINKIPVLSGIPMVTPKINYLKNAFIFVANIGTQTYLLAVDMANGKTEVVNAHKVSVNDYRVHVFGQNQKINTIFTVGVQTCVAIVGYNKFSKVGFLAHFSPKYKNIEETLSIIEEEIKKTDASGFRDMDLYIIGGLKGEDDSYNNVVKAYREMRDRYNINYQGNKIYHLGRPYNIIMDDNGVDVY